MNILVTGGAGFIGSQVADAYIEHDHHVVIIDNLSTGQKEFINSKAVFYEADITDPSVAEIIRNENIQVINHHAAQISVHDSVKDPVADAKSNIIGTLQLLQHTVSSAVGKFIFASTGGAIYGEQDYFPADEEHPTKPTSPYGLSKLSVEGYLRFYQEQYGLSTTVLRYGNVFGPRQNPHGEAGVVAIFCNRLLKDQAPVINGDGEQTRDYVFVRDVVRANVMALGPDCSGIFNVGTGREATVNELTRSLLQRAGSDIAPQYAPGRGYEQRRSCLDCKKIKDSLAWEPKVSLKEGLIETYKFFTNNKN
jgi:UDP-glucose 4-epimerase